MKFADCPYSSRPASARWRDTMGAQATNSINPNLRSEVRVTRTTKIATAGSCFAKRIAGSLAASGYNYFVTEPGPTWLTQAQRSAYNYGTFSARYGNLYTSAQLLQLFHRAYGRLVPQEPLWMVESGYVDPLRPRIQQAPFFSEEEAVADRTVHLDSVRRMFEELDVFIFTLGLTESWRCRSDGTVLPVCPGCGAGGKFDPHKYAFHNSTFEEVVAELNEFVEGLAEVNPSARVILTVSPVPLVATMEDRHVLQSTVYSKSLLRVAAEEIVRKHRAVSYFASYEVITATQNAYFAEDRRSVTEAGVAHVMRTFFHTYTDDGDQPVAAAPQLAEQSLTSLPTTPCDEEALAAALARAEHST